MILVRADGNARIGAGHLMRCMTIMEEVKKMVGDREILFVCADEDSARTAKDRGFRAVTLESDYRDPEGELPCWEKLTEAYPGQHTILVDSYFVTASYLAALKKFCRKLYLMDDLQEKSYPVDGVINYNVFADPALYARMYEGQDTELLLGSRYVPIRPEFLHHRVEPSREVKQVLITTGGGDADNIGGRILEAIYRERITFHLVAGRFNPHLEELNAFARLHPNVQIHSNVSDMAGLMAQCDLAVTAGGTTIYELAALGIPFFCFSYAQNQEALTRYIGGHRIAGYCGAWHLDATGALTNIVREFDCACDDFTLRQRWHCSEKELIDGLGARRLAEHLASI